MREGEGNHLARIGRVGHDFLVARHRRVEAELGHADARGPKSFAVEYCAVSQNQAGGWCLGHGASPNG